MEDFFYVGFDVFSDAFDEGVADAAFHRFIAPGVVLSLQRSPLVL